MSLTSTTGEAVLTSREMLARVLHELAQPLSALECSLELGLYEEADVRRSRGALETSLEIAHRLSKRLVHFRDLSEALLPCDCLQPMNAAEATSRAVQEVRELANSLAVSFDVSVEALPPVYGNPEKLQFALVRMFDWLFQNGKPAHVYLFAEDSPLGEIRLAFSGERKDVPSSRSLEVVRAALTTIGAGLRIEVHASEVEVTISFSSYDHPKALTSVLLGEF